MLDPLSNAAYDAALSEHRTEIEPELRRLEAAIEGAANTNADTAGVARLRTMRVLLSSGLFDRDYYLNKYADIREAQVDPLEHYVLHGDAEGRLPNLAFFPEFYRRHSMTGAPPDSNALRHYIEQGERSGAKPNFVFDGQTYLAANPGFIDFVDRPLFHYLNLGKPAGDKIRGAPLATTLEALDYIDEVVVRGSADQGLLLKAKRALSKGLGIHEGFTIYRQLVDRPEHAEIHLKRLESLREAVEKKAGAFRETRAAGEWFLITPPRVIGEGNHRPLAGRTRSMFVGCLIDARVRASSNIVEINDSALLDYEGEERARIDDELDFDPAVFQATDDEAWIITPRDETPAVDIEEAFTLLGLRATSFGHWVLEYLAKYIAASLSGALPRVPVLIEADLPDPHRHILQLMLPHGVELIELPRFTTARVRRLWCAPTLVHFPVWEKMNERFRWEYFAAPPHLYVPVIREMSRRAAHAYSPSPGFDRVFLARKPSTARDIVNHTAIQAIAQARGFLVIYPEDHDFVEQVNLLRSARYVLGPDGSAMLLNFFARPGTKLCILINSDTVISTMAELTTLFGEIGLDVTLFTGRCVRLNPDYPIHSDCEIDEVEFSRFLDRWLPPDAGRRPPADHASSRDHRC